MAATTTARKTLSLEEAKYHETIERDVSSGVEILAGTMVALNASNEWIVAGATGHVMALGRAQRTVEADDTDRSLRVDGGVFRWENAGDIAANDVGKQCNALDNQTVDMASTTKPAGIIYDLDDYGVWVIQGMSTLARQAATAT
jgi:hypothetical protein